MIVFNWPSIMIGLSGEPQIVNHFMESILLDLCVGMGEKLTLEAGCAKYDRGSNEHCHCTCSKHLT